ncbi:SCO4225 family membrane protein [Streptomyces indicus]|uniref:Uncharacterized protein n=1 Tax=Streptomyces indicus TaxID=417292 RepID=A0A1G8ULC8_9ACTN|nr:hypothetical protein [Streptomyces indicus]SDJ54529.1 hypothetical protein SAMN05421806_101923 [Streptomyces indicus]
MKSLLRRLIRLTVTNPLSLGYLGLIAACALAGAVYEGTVADAEGFVPGYWAALLPLLPTLLLYVPLEDVVYGGPAPTGWLFHTTAVLSFLLQSAAMGRLWSTREPAEDQPSRRT